MRVKPLIAIPLIAIALAGCAAQQPMPQQSSIADEQKPLFASDEEALAAAQAAYANYLEVSDQIARDGGANPERLESLVSKELFQESNEVFSTYAKNFIKVEGSTTFDSLHIAEVSPRSAKFYVCLDVSRTKVLSADDFDITPQERQNRLPIVFEIKESNSLATIESSEVWTGRNYC
jgi:hypothetical protein